MKKSLAQRLHITDKNQECSIMNLVPKIKIEQITANLEAIDQQIKHAALSTNNNNIRNLIDQRRQLLAYLKTEI
jgi:hypothetical protein